MTQRFDPRFQAVEDRVKQSLADILGEDSNEYRRFSPMLDTAPIGMGHDTPRSEWVQGYQEGISASTERLKSLRQLLEEKLAESQGAQEVAPQSQGQGRKVFIVHGHDEAAKQEVARFLERLRLEAVVLHE